MAHSNTPSRGDPKDAGLSSLESLSRTLEALESRLSRLTPAQSRPPRPEGDEMLKAAVPSASETGHWVSPQGPVPHPLQPQGQPPIPAATAERRHAHLSESASDMVLRRQMSGGDGFETRLPNHGRLPELRPARAHQLESARLGEEPRLDPGLERRFQALAGDVEALRSEGSSVALMAEVAEELQRLRHELKTEGPARSDPRFDEMRRSFDDLREMIELRESADLIGAEMSEMSAALARLTEEGADRATLNTLRAELEEMRRHVADTAKESSVTAVGRRWDAFETRFSVQAERDAAARSDLKHELERLRESLGSLASEDHVRSVERRWDDFESQFLKAQPAAPSEDQISKLLREELETMRVRLETASAPVAEERWDAIQERLDSRDIEASVLKLAERMGEIESVLARLPDGLGIAALEERMRNLAQSVDALARHGAENEMEHFVALEERLDEISRAIVATSLQVPPTIDMAPIERIEARIATLTARVDRFTEEGDADADVLSQRIADLADRVEELADSSVNEALAARMATLAERLDTAFNEMEKPQIDTAAIEKRLAALALRLEDAVQPSVDPELMRSLEAQIGRLSEHLVRAGSLSEDADEAFEKRLAVVERRLEDNREQLLAAARQAADETAQRMQEAGERRQSEHVAKLSQNLASLEQLSRETDGRSTQVFDAVHATLLKIVDRLEMIETEISRGADGGAQAGDEWVVGRTAGRPGAARAGSADLGDQRLAAAFHAAPLAALAAQEPSPSEAAVAQSTSAVPKSFIGAIANRMPGRVRQEAAAVSERIDHLLLDRDDAQAEAVVGPKSESVEAERPRDQLDAPALDASGLIERSEANRLLEPGSGAPDIGALLERVRLQQRNKAAAGAGEPIGEAETRAAARRAVKAAVAEAELLRSPSAKGAPDAPKSSFADLVSRRRKTILMGVTAVLVALAALPVGKAVMSRMEAAAEKPVSFSGTAAPDAGASMPSTTGTAPLAIAPLATTAEARRSAAAETPAGTPATLGPSGTGPASPTLTASLPSQMSPEPMAPLSTAPLAATTGLPGALSAADVPAIAAMPAAAGGKTEITDTTDDAAILASAEAKLPASANAAQPDAPQGIGTSPLLEAAKASDPKALFEIGLRLLEGRGGEPKPAEALDWFARSAKLGFAPAQYSMGTLYEKGNGVARDTVAARDWYLLASKQGNVRAMHNLAVLYATGIDGKSEPETAATWFERAAEYGMRDSQYNLGILYARGSGVEMSLADSYKWFAIVAAGGDKDAEVKRDEVGKELAPDQLAAAKAEVAAWSPKERPEAANTVELPQEWADAKADRTASVDMKRAVRNIQAILGKLGYDAGTPDGVVGGKTTTAIVAFQKASGLKATGEIDETLIRALLDRKDS